MLAKRIIPCLDVRNGRVVKGTKFADIRDVEDPVVLAKRYSAEGADELVFYDITATAENRPIFIETVRRIAKEINIPFTIGGGIRCLEDFREVLYAGADKVSVNSAAVKNPSLIREAAKVYGSQCVVLSVDAKRKAAGQWEVYVAGGRENTHKDALAWVKEAVALGAGEICLNSIDADGVKQGYDLELNRCMAEAVSVPIIASGGAGTKEHFGDVFQYAGVDAALAASVFHYETIGLSDLKEYLHGEGIAVRRV